MWYHPENIKRTTTFNFLALKIIRSFSSWKIIFYVLHYFIFTYIRCICSSYLWYFFQWWHKVNITHNGQRMKHVDGLWNTGDTLLATWLIRASETEWSCFSFQAELILTQRTWRSTAPCLFCSRVKMSSGKSLTAEEEMDRVTK